MSTTRNGSGISRRRFVSVGGAAVAGSLLGNPVSLAAAVPSISRRTQKMRVALVGTGTRAIGMWGRSVVQEHSDVIDYVGLCDSNPGRLAYASEFIGADCPTYLHTDFDRMIEETRPDQVIVCTTDSTHDHYIVRSMELGCDVITEKPMTTDEVKCQAILDAQQRTGRQVTMTHNNRYRPTMQRLKEYLLEERVGEVVSVDFNYYLDVYHGADYFRRWHGEREHSGTLLLHKSSHHFDLLNWWLDSEPEEVFGYGGLDYYGKHNPYRHTNCRGCPFAQQCPHYWDITQNERLVKLFVENEHYDGYLRDGCVWREEIDIYDKMGVVLRYANGVQATYTLTTYSPYEGFRLAFNGKKGRMEIWMHYAQPWPTPDYDEIRITDNFGETELIQVPHVAGGHQGADPLLRRRIFRDYDQPDALDQVARLRDGIMSILPGVAARQSIDTGKPVKIAGLSTLTPRAKRATS